MWTSSQSSTAANPDSSTIRFPIRKSPVPAAAVSAAADARPANETPTRMSRWCRASRRAGCAVRSAVRFRSNPILSGSARWMAASAPAHCRSSKSRPPSPSALSRFRCIFLTMVSPLHGTVGGLAHQPDHLGLGLQLDEGPLHRLVHRERLAEYRAVVRGARGERNPRPFPSSSKPVQRLLPNRR